MPDAAPLIDLESADPATLLEQFAVVRRARELGERLFGLGVARLSEPPNTWSANDRDRGVGSPPHLLGYLAVHADADARRVTGARARVGAEAAMPQLQAARRAGRLAESTYRQLCLKATPETIDDWLAQVPPRADRTAVAGLNAVLREARRPGSAPPADAPAASGVPPPTAGERPDAVRGRIAARRRDAAPTASNRGANDSKAAPPQPRPPLHPVTFNRRLYFNAFQHDAWWRATQRVRGDSKQTPSPGAVLTALLEHFGSVDLDAVAPAALREIDPGRRIFIDPVASRAWLATNQGRLEVTPPDPERDPLRRPTVVVRRARGKTCPPTPAQLRREFPELFWPAVGEACRRRVRKLLGYPADRPACVPCPPLSRRRQRRAAPIPEDTVPPQVVEACDPRAQALPGLSPAATAALTAAAGRAEGQLRGLELDIVAALKNLEAHDDGAAAALQRLGEMHGLSTRARQELAWLAGKMRQHPALRLALRDGLAYSKVRAIAAVATKATLDGWIAFAGPRPARTVAAFAAAAAPGDSPPVVPEGMDPLLPLGARVYEDVHAELSPEQQVTWQRLQALVERMHGRSVDDATVAAVVAGWFVVRRSGRRRQRDAVVYQRAPETRVPIELRRAATEAEAQARGLQGLPWLQATGATIDSEWDPPDQRPGQPGVPAAIRRAVIDRDGHRCATPGCGNNLILQHNHGRRRCRGAVADPDSDQRLCGPGNNAHGEFRLELCNRPDGGVWAWDRQGRRLGSVAPVARHLDAPLVRRLLQQAADELAADELGADEFGVGDVCRPAPCAQRRMVGRRRKPAPGAA